MRENSLPAVEIVALAMLFAGALTYFQLSGLGYTFDSSRYLYFASQMALNGNYSTNIVYAPLYPIVLSLLLRVGLPFDLATALIAAGSVAAIWYFALRALSFLTADRLAAALGATFIGLFAFQQPIFEYIWTEQLYAALLSAAAFLAVSYCAGSSRRLPLAALLVTSILPGARYIGAFPMAAFGAVLLLTFWRRNCFQLRVLPLAAAGGLAIGSTFLVIAAYHLSQGSCVLGCRRPSTTSLADNVEFTLSVLADDVGPYALALGVGLGLAMIVSAATGRFSLRSFKPVQFLPLGVVAVAIAGQLYSSTSAKIDPISTRYFAPYYPLVWISLLAVTYAALPKTGLIWSRTLSAIALSAGIAASLYAAVFRAEMLINANVSERWGLSGTFAKLNPIIDKVHNVIGAEIDRKDHVDIAFVHPKYSSVSAAGIALNNETFPADANCSLLELAPTPRDRTETIAAKFHCKLGERRVDVTALLAQQFSRIGDDPDLVIMQKPWSEDRPTEIDALVENEGYSVAIEHPSLIVLRRHDR